MQFGLIERINNKKINKQLNFIKFPPPHCHMPAWTFSALTPTRVFHICLPRNWPRVVPASRIFLTANGQCTMGSIPFWSCVIFFEKLPFIYSRKYFFWIFYQIWLLECKVEIGGFHLDLFGIPYSRIGTTTLKHHFKFFCFGVYM